jgi:ABC-type lipoprotein export system ATPase subunit
LGLKDKIEEKNVKTLKKGQEQRIETKRAMIKSKGKTN